MVKLKLFTLSLLLTMGGFLIFFYTHRPKDTAPFVPKLVPVAGHIFITAQLEPGDVPFLKSQGINDIVDIRPDGEESGQASASEIEQESKRNQMDFHYIPVPHEQIPDAAVDALGDVLSHQPQTTVLYCRSGRRAVRTFALAEASRPGGPGAGDILDMVRKAGFSADDLRDNISQRISRRNNPPTNQTDDLHSSRH